VLATAFVVAAAILVHGDRPLRWRLVGVFLAMALAPSLLTWVVVWRELAPRTRLAASLGLERSMESALLLARESLATHRARAESLAVRAADRAAAHAGVESGDTTMPPTALDALGPPSVHAAIYAPAAHRVWATAGGWTLPEFQDFLAQPAVDWPDPNLPAELFRGPDSSFVVVGTQRVQAPKSDPSADLVALVALPVPPDEAAAILAVVQGMQHTQRLGYLEELKLDTTTRLLAVLAAVYILVAVLLGILLARTLTHPIERLRRAFEAVAGGELGHQVELGTAREGELGRLLRGFNTMSRELEDSKQQLVRAARLAAWQDVARRLAHEIKNPLTPITLSIHRLRRRTTEEDTVVRECLDTILEETSHLERLANEFSSFARMPKPDMRPLQPGPLLQQVVDLYAAHARVRIHADLGDMPTVVADRDQIRQVFTNLLKNAVEAMPEGGTIAVRWEQHDGTLDISFLDSGNGFTPQALEHLFDPTFTTKPGGSGLGLAIVRRILDDHEGSIEIGNRTEGGAWVRVRLRTVPERRDIT
jgi:signal transduction histidine kinase